MKTPINSRTLKQHFAYNWWKYLLAAVLAFGLVDLLYSVTAYRSPPEKRVEFYVYGQMDQERLAAYMENVRATEMNDMEVMAPLQLLDDGYYGSMQLMTYMAVGEGDVYLLPRDEFVTGASGGSFLPLENDRDLMKIFDDAGISLQNGWRRNAETGENHLCGIPQNKLPGLSRYAEATNGYLCVIVNNGNEENVLKYLRILCRDMLFQRQGCPSMGRAAKSSLIAEFPASVQACASSRNASCRKSRNRCIPMYMASRQR